MAPWWVTKGAAPGPCILPFASRPPFFSGLLDGCGTLCTFLPETSQRSSMQSRAARLTSCAVAWTVSAAAAFFLVQSEQQISQRREAFRTFDQHAREATDALADMRAAQHAYVAAGQGVAFWMPKVAALMEDVSRDVDRLRASAGSAAAGSSLI